MGDKFDALSDDDKLYALAQAKLDWNGLPSSEKIGRDRFKNYMEARREEVAATAGGIERAKENSEVQRIMDINKKYPHHGDGPALVL